MTTEEFRGLLQQRTDAQLLGPCLRDEATPYVFEARPATWDSFRDVLVSELAITRADITVVGSARLGFSMKPGNNLKKFNAKSDIDVAIVNPSLFDQLWLMMLEAAYPRFPMTQELGGWLQQRRSELYTGWIRPTEVHFDVRIVGPRALPAMQFRAKWFNALKKAAKHPPARHEDVTGRLYRTWEHAQLYHLNSLAALRRSLLQ